jgi:hypothetical protein
MSKLLITVVVLLAVNSWWWREADRRLRRTGGGRTLRGVLSLFMAAQFAYLLWIVLGEFIEDLSDWRPIWLPMGAYVWNVLLLPAGCLWFLIGSGWGRWTKRPSVRRAVDAIPDAPDAQLSRRQVLAAAAVAAPPLISILATRRAMSQMGEFRIRSIELNVPGLPVDLNGLTIAHVTDLHIGRFMPPHLTAAMADAANSLDCDLIAFTGDLIDASQKRLAPGIDFMRRLRPKSGMAMIEGNHDVVRNAAWFEAGIRDAGLPLLLDETMRFRVPGRPTPVQFLGTTWGELKSGVELKRHGKERNYWFREYGEEARDASVRHVASMREPAAFPILLAHHPHAFDAAAAAGLPLVLSGHTHGGQIMLTQNIGAGPLRFRYWSGLYRKPGSRMFISNGIGSWFPLRVNAPSEIVKITLVRGNC